MKMHSNLNKTDEEQSLKFLADFIQELKTIQEQRFTEDPNLLAVKTVMLQPPVNLDVDDFSKDDDRKRFRQFIVERRKVEQEFQNLLGSEIFRDVRLSAEAINDYRDLEEFIGIMERSPQTTSITIRRLVELSDKFPFKTLEKANQHKIKLMTAVKNIFECLDLEDAENFVKNTTTSD